MSTFYDRLLEEKDALDGRIEKLDSFLKSDKISSLDSAQSSLLKIQFNIMSAYSQVLEQRLSLLQQATVTV